MSSPLEQIFESFIEQATAEEINPLLLRDQSGVPRIERFFNMVDSETGDTLLHIAIKALDKYKFDVVKYNDCLAILKALRMDYYHYANVFIENNAEETAYDLLKALPPIENKDRLLDIVNHYPNRFSIGPGEIVELNSQQDKKTWEIFNKIAKGIIDKTINFNEIHTPVYTLPNGTKISPLQMAAMNGHAEIFRARMSRDNPTRAVQENRINRGNELIHHALQEYSTLGALEALLAPASEFQQLAQGLFFNPHKKSLDLIKTAVTAIKHNAQYATTIFEMSAVATAKTHTQILSSLQAKAQMQDALYALASHIGMPITEKFLKTYDDANDPTRILQQHKNSLICKALREYQHNDATSLEKLLAQGSEARYIIRKPLKNAASWFLTDYDTTAYNLITAAITSIHNNTNDTAVEQKTVVADNAANITLPNPAEKMQDALYALVMYADMPVSRNYFNPNKSDLKKSQVKSPRK